MAQAVYTVALTDENAEVRAEAWNVLFPFDESLPTFDPSQGAYISAAEKRKLPNDFVQYLLDYLTRQKGLAERPPYRLFLTTLEMDKDIDIKTKADIAVIRAEAQSYNKHVVESVVERTGMGTEVADVDLLNVRSQLLTLKKAESQTSFAGGPIGWAGRAPASIAVSVADADLKRAELSIAACDNPTPALNPRESGVPLAPAPSFPPMAPQLPGLPSDGHQIAAGTVRDTIELLGNADVATFAAALGSLPPEVLRQLPAHVEIFDFSPDGKPGAHALEAQRALREKGRFITPMPQSLVGTKSERPPNIEVRYFDPQSTNAATEIKRILTEADLGGSVTLSKALTRKSDLEVYRDMTKHFEVWFPAPVVNSASEPPAATGSSGSGPAP